LSILADPFKALVRASEPIALTSIFPYAWKLVLFYNVGSEHDAAFYAGLLIAAFSFSEALTGFFWGSLSDHIGRKKVLLFGNAGTLLSLLVVGFARTYRVALFGRIMGGLLNGNIGVLQVSPPFWLGMTI
jgi:MFS family permease